MFIGVLCGLITTFIWGTAYLLPATVPEYGAAALMMMRAIIVGATALVIMAFTWSKYRVLTKADWKYAFWLSMVGVVIQPVFLYTSVEYAGVCVGALSWGGVPVVVALVSNYLNKKRGKTFVPWKILIFPLALIVAGFVLANYTELEELVINGTGSVGRFAFGVFCGLFQIALWTWYGIKNADWVQAHPDVPSDVWTSAQLLPALPAGLICYPVIAFLNPDMGTLLGPRPAAFMLVSLYSGVVTTYVAVVFLNICAARLPTALLGELLVFETIFGIILGLIWDKRWPGLTLTAGIVLLIAGVLISLEIFARASAKEKSDEA